LTTLPTRSVNWSRRLAPYKEPLLGRSLWELAVTAVPLFGLWAVALWAAKTGAWWAALLLAVVAAGFLLRLFLIQHDCGHGAFFRSAKANDWLGRIASVFHADAVCVLAGFPRHPPRDVGRLGPKGAGRRRHVYRRRVPGDAGVAAAGLPHLPEPPW
jgi:hypothetical protein